MSDSSGGWFYRPVDYMSLGCMLLGSEEGIRSLVSLIFKINAPFPTLPWQAWTCSLVIGFALSFAGEKGPILWKRISGRSLKEENSKLKAELDTLKNRPTPVAPLRPGVPPNAEDLLYCWRNNVNDAHLAAQAQSIHPAIILVGLPHYPTLRQYLSPKTKEMIDQARKLPYTLSDSPMDPVLNSVLDDIERASRSWGIR